MRAVCRLIALLLAAAQATAQTPAPAAQPPVFRTATRLVEISVVVHDSRGQPVSDLKKEDFALTERGKPQQVAFFSMASADRPATPSGGASAPHLSTS